MVNDVIIRPISSDKSIEYRGQVYMFIVNKNSNKLDIKNAVEKFFKVLVKSVNVINCTTKKKSIYTKKKTIEKLPKNYKKAIVYLRIGSNLDFSASNNFNTSNV
jgi:large subunit ribosomal protein L23